MAQDVGSERVVYASAARTATPTQTVFTSTRRERGGHFVIDVTAVTLTPSVVPTIEGYSTAADKWYTLLTGTAIVTTGTVVLKVYPGVTAAANVAASDLLPATWRVTMTHGNANSATYSVSANLVP